VTSFHMDTDTKMQFELGIFQKSESFAGLGLGLVRFNVPLDT